MITINRSKCIGCGRCAYDCFPGALQMKDHSPVMENKSVCIRCAHCIAVCPVSAISDPDLEMDEIQQGQPERYPEVLLAQMKFRRSCRHYTNEPVTDHELQYLIDAARCCPTAKNLQTVRFISVKEKIPQLLNLALETLEEIGLHQRETATDPSEIRRANNFVAWAENRRKDNTFDPLFFHASQLLMFVSEADTANDTAAAAAYAELMAFNLGLGCLYSGYFTACAAISKDIRILLGLSEHERVVRCLVLGHPDIRFLRSAPKFPASITEL